MGLRSLNKALRALSDRGEYHNRSAIQKSAWFWLTDPSNWREARGDFDFYCQKKGRVPTEEEWNIYLGRAVAGVFYNRDYRLKDWISKNGMFEWGRKYMRRDMERIGFL